MSKLTGPLLSFDARGKLANSLVFIGWKGLKTVRQYVIPANPNTLPQQAQRSRMRETTATWKTLTADLKTAWNALAQLVPTPMAGFNSFTQKEMLQDAVPESTLYNNVMSVIPGAASFSIRARLCVLNSTTELENIPSITVAYGPNGRNLTDTANVPWTSGQSCYLATVGSLEAAVDYVMQLRKSGIPISGLKTVTTT